MVGHGHLRLPWWYDPATLRDTTEVELGGATKKVERMGVHSKTTDTKKKYVIHSIYTRKTVDMLSWEFENFQAEERNSHKGPGCSGYPPALHIKSKDTGRTLPLFSWFIEGNLEVKFLTIWTDEKQRWEESERKEKQSFPPITKRSPNTKI